MEKYYCSRKSCINLKCEKNKKNVKTYQSWVEYEVRTLFGKVKQHKLNRRETMKTFNDLIDELDGEVTILDVMKYPELLYTEIKLVEAWETDENGYPTDHDLNEPMKVWQWIGVLNEMARGINGYCDEDYARLITMNMEEA